MARHITGILLLVLLTASVTIAQGDASSSSTTEGSTVTESTATTIVTEASTVTDTDSVTTTIDTDPSAETDTSTVTDTESVTSTSDTDPPTTIDVTTDDSFSGVSTGSSESSETVTDLSESSTTPVPTTTKSPGLTGSDLFEETSKVLNSIDATLSQFNDSLNSEATDDPVRGPLHLINSRLEELYPIDDMCTHDTDPCATIQTTLNNINAQLYTLVNAVDSWNDRFLLILETNNDTLNRSVDQIHDENLDTFDIVAAKKAVEQTKQLVDDGITESNNQYNFYKKQKENSVIFTAVFGTIGGLMVVGLIGALVFFAAKKNSSKASNSKGYNKVNEERIPIGDFINAHADQPGYSREEPFPGRAGPSSSGGPPPIEDRDPYARGTAGRGYREPYATGTSPRNNQESRSAFATGKSSGLRRNY